MGLEFYGIWLQVPVNAEFLSPTRQFVAVPLSPPWPSPTPETQPSLWFLSEWRGKNTTTDFLPSFLPTYIPSFKIIFLKHKCSFRHYSRLWRKWVWQTRSPFTTVRPILKSSYLYWNSSMTDLKYHFPHLLLIHSSSICKYVLCARHIFWSQRDEQSPLSNNYWGPADMKSSSEKSRWRSFLIFHPQMFTDYRPSTSWWIANKRDKNPGYWNMAKEGQWVQDQE